MVSRVYRQLLETLKGESLKKPISQKPKKPPSILTRTGYYFDFLNPDPSTILASDIGHALSNVCRFAGHVDRFYSVAQHSVIVSYLVPPEFALEGLMHDAHEAYLGDVTTPLKSLLPDYRTIEDRVDLVIRIKYGLPELMSWEVKRADYEALLTERKLLMPWNKDQWTLMPDLKPAPEYYWDRIYTPQEAFILWMNRYTGLMPKIGTFVDEPV